MINRILLTLFINFLISPFVNATEQYPDWSIKGFGSFGYITTDTNSLGFVRNRTQTQSITKSGGITTDSRLGVQLDVDFNQSLHATVQWIARDHGGDFLEQNLEWAFLRWHPFHDIDLRVGRLAMDTFLVSDYRNVGFAYPWMRPSHDFYANLSTYHVDGLDISKRFSIDSDYLTLKFFAGYGMNHFPTALGLFEMDMPMSGISLSYESNNWLTRVVYNFQRFVTEVPNEELTSVLNNPNFNNFLPNISSLTPHVSLKDTNLHYVSLGTRYDDATWLIHAEASYLNSQTSLIGETVSGYLSIGRRFSNLTLYSVYGIAHGFHSNVDIPDPVVADPALLNLQASLDVAINNNSPKQQSFSLGARWDVHPKIALKTQWSHYWFGNNGAVYWRHLEDGNKPDQVNVWSVGVDFIF